MPSVLDDSVALVTLASAKAALGITASTEDNTIEALINRMSQLASTYCARKFVSDDYTQDYDGSGCDALLVHNYPVTALASVKVDATRSFDSSSEIDSGSLLLDGEAGMVRVWNAWGRFPSGKANVRVEYTAGYTVAAVAQHSEIPLVPADLQHAVILMVMHAYKREFQDKAVLGVQNETVGDRTTTYDLNFIPKKAQAVLDRYVNVNSATHGN